METSIKPCLKRKQAETPDECVCGAENSAEAPAAETFSSGGAVPGIVQAPAESDAARPQGQESSRPKAVMSREWVESVLADENKPLPFTERHLKNPVLADAFRTHERSRATYAEYQDWVRREYETKGYVEIDDDFDERCELLQAVSTAAFYGREDEEKEAMAKLAALRPQSGEGRAID